MSGSERQVDSPATSGGPRAIAPAPEAPGSAENEARARRRRRAANAEKQMFYFVDESSSSKEKRAHVMRHHVEEKRKLRKLSRDLGHEPMIPEHIQELGSWDAMEDPAYKSGNQTKIAVQQDSSVPLQLPIRFSTVRYAQPTPMQLLPADTLRKNPNSNPPASTITLTPEDAELAEYWTSKLTYWSGQNTYVKDQMFQTAMRHPVSFQATVLTYCARWKAQIHETPNSEEVQRHLGQARKNIHDASVGSLPVDEDYLAMALAGMALGEDRFGRNRDAQAYLDHAVRIMRPRTGKNRPVEAFLHYVRLIVPPSPTTVVDPAPQWSVAFLRTARDIMLQHSAPEYLAQAPQRCDVFQMESPLFSLLSSGPRPSQVPQEARMYVVRDPQTQEVSRTAALIFITLALWDFKDSIPKTVRFLTYLHDLIGRHQLDRQPACETLLWLLLEQSCEPDLRNPERAWSAGEMVKSHRQLRPDLQFHFNEILMSFLTLRAPIRGIDQFEADLLLTSNAQ
ncbi:hypothetical protein N7490_001180 [Penicillium lividum]|nr:hypothetical protein N7490_001180 [Penicillium lividum]